MSNFPRLAHGPLHGEHELETRQPRWPYVALGVGAAIFFYLQLFHFPFVPIWANDQDGTIFLCNAARMVHGDVLYRDLFQFNLPGTEYLYYFLFLCFGIRLWIAPLVLLITLTAAALLLYWLARVVLRGAAALLPACAFLAFCERYSMDGTHHWYSTVLVLFAIGVVARSRRLASIGAAGALLGVATLFTSSRGVFVATGVCLFFLWRFRGPRNAFKPIAALLIPLAVVVGSVLAWLAAIAGPRTVFDSIVTFPLRYYAAGHGNQLYSFSAVLNGGLASGLQPLRVVALDLLIMWVVPLVLVAVLITCLLRGNALRDLHGKQALALYAFAGTFALFPGLGTPSLLRLSCATALALVLGTALISQLGWRRVIAGALAVSIAAALGEMVMRSRHPVYEFRGPRGTVALESPDDYRLFTWIARQAHPGDRLFGDPDLNFVMALSNPAKVQWVESDAYTRPEQVRELLTTLKQNPTRFIVWFEESPQSPGPGDGLLPFRTYVSDHYHPALSFDDGSEILVANPGDPAGQ